ncbi:MAG TPA: selenoneine biosynthesis selenosugar synthase SenB [Marinobacter sp.]|uniref:selenoneine biosynthesis selenosugar synthase SenB n=1 Tax=Marinobacter sp. TaxID=50741 RepID=UPI0026384254|nr:selenoneine biosynthesis selenosugar synthase SenB [Marinobacter sp.]HET8801328.1 selenoneine biosynthesis selenosugar synthase SenB [Marinobacter sp.]
MHILLITPAEPGSKAGNRATAERWQGLLAQCGHTVSVITTYHGEPCDLLIALHAWRSHDAVQRFRASWPDHPLIVALTGTDIYRHQREYPEQTRYSMLEADALIGLHHQVAADIPEEFGDKLITLYQSAPQPRPTGRQHDTAGSFDVCVVGHLRDEKDSLRAACAARLLPEDSRIRVLCAGKAHNEYWQNLAVREMQRNPRFRWLGELEKQDTEALLSASRLMVISSVMEGGANVVSEACRAGLPIIASAIPGNIGLLGDDYPGYYPAKDEQALAGLLFRAETDPGFLQALTRHVSALSDRFTPEQELQALERALALAGQRCALRAG